LRGSDKKCITYVVWIFDLEVAASEKLNTQQQLRIPKITIPNIPIKI
jgi:hypothetical protein